MFGKLMKYEFKATSRTMVPLILIISAISVLAGLTKSVGFTLLLVLSLMFAVAVPFILSLTRFQNNLLGKEGYLMMTLPVSTGELILAKLLTIVIWYVLILAVIIIDILFAGVLFVRDDLSLATFIPRIMENGGTTLEVMGRAFVQSILPIITDLLQAIMTIYFCCAFGQLFNEHRQLIGIVAYFAIVIVKYIFIGNYIAFELSFFTLANVVIFAVLFAGTWFILDRHLNLE